MQRRPISADQIEWLRHQNNIGMSYKDMASHVGVCTDTLKRILHRNRIVLFDGAKYQDNRDVDLKLWSRPCSSCGDTTPRPKWKFFCRPCAEKRGFTPDD